MALEFSIRSFVDAGSTIAIQRFFIELPTRPKHACLIKQIDWYLLQLQRITQNYDVLFGMSLDPDDPGDDISLTPDSRMFLTDSWQKLAQTNVGFDTQNSLRTYHYPDGIVCPYTRLPIFVQHSNTNVITTNHHIRVFYEFIALSARDLSIAVLRRGRAVTRNT